MTELEHDLPEGLAEWIAQVGQGEITHIQRHVARREAWVVDIVFLRMFVGCAFRRARRKPGCLATLHH